jgi:hypothetical protein
MWYSGGQTKSHEGIGYAYSSDGLNWTRSTSNPIMHWNNGVLWRNERTYTPVVMKDGDLYKMWFSGKDTSGNYAIGYATSLKPGADYVTIQDAINAANAGDTIQVAAGTYPEKLVVAKPLTFIGEESTRPKLDMPAGDDGGITITASDVVFENFHFYRADQEYHTGGFNSLISIPRGGTWGSYFIAYERPTFRNVLFEGGRRAGFISAADPTFDDCEFRDQARDSLFFANVSGITNVLNSDFSGLADTKKAIIFENHSDIDPGVSGTINILNNKSVGKANFLVYNQWLHLEQKVILNIIGNDIQDPAGTAIDIYNLNPEVLQGKFEAINASSNSFAGIPEGEYAIVNRSTDITVNATNNWWGTTVGTEIQALLEGAVNYDPWLTLSANADPVSMEADGASISTITADMTKNSAGEDTSEAGNIPDGLQINFTATKGLITGSAETVNGKAVATLTSSENVETATIKASAPPYTANTTAIIAVFFTKSGVAVEPESVKTETTPAGEVTVDAKTEADTTVEKKGNGTPTITVAEYTDNPGNNVTRQEDSLPPEAISTSLLTTRPMSMKLKSGTTMFLLT